MRLFSSHPTFKSLIQHFTPNWFAVNMGTGITALCLGNMGPVSALPLIHDVAVGIWGLNIFLFLIFLGFWFLSVILFPKLHLELLKNSSLPFALGCLPMALITIVNGFILFGLPLWGDVSLHIAECLWFLDAVLAVLVVIIVPYCMFIYHQQDLSSATTVWLLPVVASEVAAASAGIIGMHTHGLLTEILLISGYMLWGISLPLAFSIIVIFLQRLIFHKLPPKEVGATIWLPLGPIGTGALSLMTLGESARRASAEAFSHDWLVILPTLYDIGIWGGMILMGFGTWIALMAAIITLHYVKNGMKYNMTFWSFTFPLGVYTLAVLTLARLMENIFFHGVGEILTLIVTLIWLWVGSKTLPGFLRGNFIKNPLV